MCSLFVQFTKSASKESNLDRLGAIIIYIKHLHLPFIKFSHSLVYKIDSRWLKEYDLMHSQFPFLKIYNHN